MNQIDWSFVIKLLCSGGVGLALLKWAAPVLLRQVIRDTIQDVIGIVDDHDNRMQKNELGIQTQSKEMTKLHGTVQLIQKDLEVIKRIDRNMETLTKEVVDLGKGFARIQGRWEQENTNA